MGKGLAGAMARIETRLMGVRHALDLEASRRELIEVRKHAHRSLNAPINALSIALGLIDSSISAALRELRRVRHVEELNRRRQEAMAFDVEAKEKLSGSD